jgi:hypothetical protein
LKLDASLVNERGESFICLEVTPDAEGKVSEADGSLRDGASVVVVQSDVPMLTVGEKGRTPLAMLVYREGATRPEVHQIAFFHFRYESAQPASGQRRHFFV